MTDDLVRLEFKLDLIIQALQESGLMSHELPQIQGIEQDHCPVCKARVQIVSNYEAETLRYHCRCRLPKTIVPGISGLTELPEDNKDGNHWTTKDADLLQPAPEGGGDS